MVSLFYISLAARRCGAFVFLDVKHAGRKVAHAIAQIDIEFSNSMIEMLFLRFKHRYLFTFPLTNFETLEKGADFFFNESNTVIPHAALKGGTPEEVITGKWNEERVKELQDRIKMARELRSKTNLSLQCPICLA